MFKARIKLMVLNELIKRQCSGYDLLKHIAAESFEKPSSGYLYPLLHQLKNSKLVTSRKEGRKTIYSITPKGKNVLRQLSQSHQEMMHNVMKRMAPVSDKKELSQLNNFHADMEKHREKMLKDMDVMHKFRQAFFALYEKNYDSKRMQIRKIIEEATKKLEKLK